MDFGWSDKQLAFRHRARSTIRELLPADWYDVAVPKSYAHDDNVEFSRVFCSRLAELGLLVHHWPVEHGGAGGTDWEQFILAEEMKAIGEPRSGQYMNVNWIGPTLMKFGTAAQKDSYLSSIASGSAVWCQGFSEPGAGTDLASLLTLAKETEDGSYLINGSKIWTSYARKADFCFLAVRTGSSRKEISIFLVPMSLPGITVRAIPGLVKDGHLNEVFFTNVYVDGAALLGELHRGWDVIRYALQLERVGVPRYHVGLKILDSAMADLKAIGRADDKNIRARAGMIASKLEAARLLTYLVVDQRVKREPPSANANIARVSTVEAVIDLLDFILEFVPDALTSERPELEEYIRISIPSGITAGTYELQLDLIASGALGLERK